MNISDGFKIKSVGIANLHEDFAGSDAWNVTVTNPRGQTLTHKFYMGSYFKGREPELTEFMSAMVTDASCVSYATSLEEFAADLGYMLDTPEDRRKTKKVYNACIKVAKRLDTFLTDEEREHFAQF